MIETEQQYEAATKRIYELMSTELGTPEGDELEKLITEIEAYEEIHYPIADPTPEDAARFRREQMGGG